MPPPFRSPLTPIELTNLARLNSPIFVLENEEEYFPEDPMAFIRASRFRHHRGFRTDQGWSKTRNRWITGDSHAAEFYDVPVSVINSNILWPDGRNRRPRDDNAGGELNVFIQPQGRRIGISDPNDKVPAFYHAFDAPHGSGLFLIIKYWIFHGYSDGVALFNHQGDWEGIAIAINLSLQPEFASYAAHGNYTRIPWRDVLTKNGRPLAFIEKGTHANFPHGRRGHANGYEWDIAPTLESLEPQPWRDYAGAWGEVGDYAGTTGPLGPLFKTNY